MYKKVKIYSDKHSQVVYFYCKIYKEKYYSTLFYSLFEYDNNIN